MIHCNWKFRYQEKTTSHDTDSTANERIEASSEYYSGRNYMFKVNNINTRTRSEICSKLTINIPERRIYELPHSDKDKQILNLLRTQTYLSIFQQKYFTISLISCDSVIENK